MEIYRQRQNNTLNTRFTWWLRLDKLFLQTKHKTLIFIVLDLLPFASLWRQYQMKTETCTSLPISAAAKQSRQSMQMGSFRGIHVHAHTLTCFSFSLTRSLLLFSPSRKHTHTLLFFPSLLFLHPPKIWRVDVKAALRYNLSSEQRKKCKKSLARKVHNSLNTRKTIKYRFHTKN